MARIAMLAGDLCGNDCDRRDAMESGAWHCVNHFNTLARPDLPGPCGMLDAPVGAMAQTYRDLVVWQLADQLRSKVGQMVTTGPPTMDRHFVADLQRSARSMAANVAEGHGRFNPAEFRRFLEIAKGSLQESESHLREGLARGWFRESDCAEAQSLVRRLTVAMVRLIRYLRSEEAKRNAARIASKAGNRSNR